MAEARAIPEETRRAQAVASDPSLSAWVSANAGSGKTFVLARRVIRLLLAGVTPARLLCLTFTKAAAAEMSNRIFEILGQWVTRDGDELDAILTDVLGRRPSAAEAARARTLFALALDTPGGLKIQTIHAFCEALLHQFPLEANVPGHFEVVEEARQKELLEEARLATLRAMQRGGEARLRDAFAYLIDHVSDATLEKALGELIANRASFSNWIGGDPDLAMLPLWQRFGLAPDLAADPDEREILAPMLANPAMADEDLSAIAEGARRIGGKMNSEFAERVAKYLNALTIIDRFRLRNKIFLRNDGEARKQWVTRSVLAECHTLTEQRLQEYAQAAEDDVKRLNLCRALRLSASLFYFADKVLAQYERFKRLQSQVDFVDLIERAGNLLNRADVRDWVRYKLDRGIDHVLIDEAQDTSPEQWAIVDAVTEEFFAGKGVERAPRTVFAVGDEKQSIFSFQGAAPEKFAEQARAIGKRAAAAGMAFEQMRLQLSFRSSPDILGAVDKVFSLPENARGLGTDEAGTVHTAIRAADPGEVRIWPVLAKAKVEEKTEWLAPIDAPAPDDPAVELARRIAATIRDWISKGEKLPGRDRPIRHGDILILVRKRDRFMTAVIRELKEAGLNIAGADRLKLTEHIAVEDLMALGRVMVLPEDDLALAGVLKSPLFALTEDDLIELCQRRGATALYDHLAQLGEDDTPLAEKAREIHGRLEGLRRVAQDSDAHGFYTNVLGREGGRKAFAARLGSEAEDVLDAFEKAALDHARQGGASAGGGLEAFLAELVRASPEIKREVDVRRDEIRVITVHAAKGLEAPIVFLVDPCSPAFIAQHAPLIVDLAQQDDRQAFLWAADIRNIVPEIETRYAAIRQGAEEEYRRLLYVAMTRAADRLIVCGYRGVREPREDHWHAMVERALKSEAREIRDGNDEIVELFWQSPATVQGHIAEKPLKHTDTGESEKTASRPDWLMQPARHEPAAPKPLNPSAAMALKGRPIAEFPQDMAQETADLEALAAQRSAAIERGIAIHRLMQMLPDAEVATRKEEAFAWLERQFPGWEAHERQEAVAEAMRIIEDARFVALFGPGSRAEAGIAGEVRIGGRRIAVSGQIDRLAVHGDEVLLADYKTNRQVPGLEGETAESYRLQLALYRTLLKQIYPRKDVRCMLIWTRNGSLTEFGADELDAVLETITPA